MNFEEIEERDGVRFTWNVFPSTRIESSRTIVPIASIYKPLNERPDLPPVLYEPVTCKAPCKAVLNPYCHIDTRAKFWICPFCLQRNMLPPQYKDISNTSLPIELLPEYSTIEYTLPRPPQLTPVFLFVVDVCQDEENLQALKDSLIISLSLLPPECLVGLVTFGTMVDVYELGYTECSKSYVFRGSKDYTSKQIQEMLGLPTSNVSPVALQQARSFQGSAAPSRFLLPIQQCEFQLTNILEQLQPDSWPVANDRRPQRCTGTALNISVSMMESVCPNSGGHIMLFAGGPSTVGPGTVVSTELREPIRSHHDIERDQAKHVKKALRFYEGLTKRVSANGHAVDILAGCLDQIGIMEMKSLASSTGGYLVLSDSFTTSIFKQSFQRIFGRDSLNNMLLGFNATMEVLTTKELKISGLIGHAVSLNKKSQNVGDIEIGLGNTNSWKMCGISPKSTYAIYFEVATQSASAPQGDSRGLVQYLTLYQHSSNTFRLRVTTVARAFADGGSPLIVNSFDQEAAAVAMARIAAFKAEVDDGPDVLRWTDRMLIKLCQKFAEYRKDDPSSFRLSSQFTLYPQFMYYLRRSPFLQVFNNSPDETAFYRHMLNHEDVNNSLIMIQPTLQSFSFEHPGGVPVLLDAVSVKPDVILLLDTFFHILIFHGDTIAQWRNAGYQNQPEYQNLKELLEAPRVEAAELLIDRFPIPRFIVCDQGGSQARFLLSRLNPSETHNTTSMYGAPPAHAILTDDVSLQTFMSHLKKLAVAVS
ncbi:COPII cargo receptor subunit Sec23a [Schizosaccharomyces pombe]|uniref:Protein transport protein sec23-1 n=1 Tax=Schizosaccharomyces pombe (strain 972 / ATCC 24843) TaxID=284812 RepID=SC231_SCHPO|nr:putative COPII cargo receptor subunit Sec23a [Schizosaccharomyces pombe]O74873.1 RecName: Full=Protein transport protein sec23-1 [Schizosaccharomyces pombe 972h-]CAA21224.1 COPII cargo receptor subunit Sec23a (predicted) [Schizosaccharomyces pombe]|eukprot:NP_587900.1 putative COPII cargo receptor subunit Sec23a [Schizosaccharomyces pombe]